MHIGVFDSGKGGEYVAARLRQLLPEHEYSVVNDNRHLPYGERQQREILALTEIALQPLLTHCRLIVVACNTATAAAIDELRARHPEHLFVGYEPMIKPMAQLTNHGIILATTSTRRSTRYQLLKASYGAGLQLDEPDTTNWARWIEDGTPQRIDFSELDRCVQTGGNVISLSCTHYLAIQPTLIDRYPEATVIEPTEAVAMRISYLLRHLPPR